MKLTKKEVTKADLLDHVLYEIHIERLANYGITKIEHSTTFVDLGRTLKQVGIRENLINKTDHDQSTQS